MTKARKYICNENLCAHYHIINRVVQRAFLFGLDKSTNINYDYRLQWVQDRLEELSKIFTIVIGGHTFMGNHFHLLLQTRPDLTESLSPCEVVQRYFKLYPPELSKKKILTTEEWSFLEEEVIKDEKLIKEYRHRLGSLSWFMKSFKEPIARRANKESNTTGHFWSERFKAKLLVSAEAVILCQAYIDLNPIRTEMADKPETSKYTSAYQRIHANKAAEKIAAIQEQKNAGKNIHPDKQKEIDDLAKLLGSADYLAPFYSGSEHLRPFYKFTKQEYFLLLDNSAREISPNKKGYMDETLDPIFERLQIDRELWLAAIINYDKWFFRIIGKMSKAWEIIKDSSNRWFKGCKINRQLFGD